MANVILSDGLANFCNNKEYKGKLRKQTNDGQKDNQQFDIVLSNPPYSVSSFRQTTRDYYTEQDFELYNSLTDNSSEIECLFIERTKQLLKDGGIAGIILPSSILSNSGIYTKAREIILQYFDIVAIAELGSNTFMATNTNTVVLFLRRRDNYFAANTKNDVNKFFSTLSDVTINGIETPASKYVAHVWEGLDYADYVTLLQKSPNDKVKAHEIYAEYKKKISAKSEAKLYETILNIEAEKLLYFVLAYPQKVVIVKSGEKNIEKRFLGYEFSNRRGSEGIHAIQRGKNIDECTQLFDVDSNNNPEKASTYIKQAFAGNYHSIISENMKSHISRSALIDMLTFDRDTYDKSISLTIKKKTIIDSQYPQIKIADLFTSIKNGKNVKQSDFVGGYRVSRIESIANAEFDIKATKWTTDIVDEQDFLQNGDILFSHINSVKYLGKTGIFDSDEKVVHGINLLRFRANSLIMPKYAYAIFKLPVFMAEVQKYAIKAANQASVNISNIKGIRIPVPPIDVQKQIVEEIGKIEKSNNDAKSLIDKNLSDIRMIINGLGSTVSIEEYFDINTLTLNPTSCWKDEFFTYVDIDSVGKGDGNISFDKKILGKDAPSRARRVAEDRTVIVSTVRPYLKGFAYIDSVPDKTIFSTGFALLKSKNEDTYISKLLYYLFMYSDDLIKQMETAMPKAAYPSINQEDIDNFKIPLLTIDEQERIVAQIEELELEITKARTLIENAAIEKQAILDKYL